MSLKKSFLIYVNWLFVIILLFLGILLTVTFFKIGLLLVIAGLIISPYFSDWFYKYLKVRIPSDVKAIIALAAILTVSVFLYQKSDEEFVFWIASIFLEHESHEKLKQFIKDKQEAEKNRARKSAFLAKREQHLAHLRSLYQQKRYEDIIAQGSPFFEFDAQIRELVQKSQKLLKQQQLKHALVQVPQLLKAGNFRQAYDLANQFEVAELTQYAEQARIKLDERVTQLQNLYEKGKYQQVITQGKPHVQSDCRIKRLVDNAQEAQQKKVELERMNKVLKKAYKFMKAREYKQAYEFARQYDYPELKELAQRAQIKLDKAIEKEILATLRNTPAEHIEENITGYTKLVKLFPDNKRYARKLAHYKKKLVEKRQELPGYITQQHYGEQWPFTVPTGILECTPPGIVSLQANNKTYAVNELALSRGYEPIEAILKDAAADLEAIIRQGLALCH